MKPIVFKKSRIIEMYELKKKHSRYKYIVLSKPKALQEVQSRVPLQVAQVPPVEQALQRPQLPARCRSWKKVGKVDDVIVYIYIENTFYMYCTFCM